MTSEQIAEVIEAAIKKLIEIQISFGEGEGMPSHHQSSLTLMVEHFRNRLNAPPSALFEFLNWRDLKWETIPASWRAHYLVAKAIISALA